MRGRVPAVEHTDCSRASRHDFLAARTPRLADRGRFTRRRRCPARSALAATHRRRRDLPGVRARARVGALGALAGRRQGATCDAARTSSRRARRPARCRPPSPRSCAARACRRRASPSTCARSTASARRRWSPFMPISRSSWPRRPRSSPRWRRSTCSARATAGARARTRPARSSAGASPATSSSSAARSASPATSCAAGSGRCAPKGWRRSPATSSSTTSRCCTSATRSRRARPSSSALPTRPSTRAPTTSASCSSR